MSQENVELYRRATQAFNDRELDAFLALMDADVEAVPRIGAVEGDYHGHDGMRRWWESLLEAPSPTSTPRLSRFMTSET